MQGTTTQSIQHSEHRESLILRKK